MLCPSSALSPSRSSYSISGMSERQVLQETKRKLEEILENIPLLRNEFKPLPIIDSSEPASQIHNASGPSPLLRYVVPIEPAFGVIPGLNVLRESIKHDIRAIDKHLALQSLRPERMVLPPAINAPYLIAVWEELIRVPSPVMSVGKIFKFSLDRDAALAEVKVDVIGDHGRSWTRINTIKNSRLLAELRELDSYHQDSDSDSDSSADLTQRREGMNDQAVHENSIFKMGEALLAAASSQTVGKGRACRSKHPDVILRLTRLMLSRNTLNELCNEGLLLTPRLSSRVEDRSSTTFESNSPLDEKQEGVIKTTLLELLKMGLNIKMGEYDDGTETDIPNNLYTAPSRRTIPTRHINLDLSALLALVSDISHSPLPTDVKDALLRFVAVRKEQERMIERKKIQKKITASKNKANKKLKADPGGRALCTNKDRKEPTRECPNHGNHLSSFENFNGKLTTHSRALGNQAMQERRLGLFEELAGQSYAPVQPDCKAGKPQLEFWTTADVRERFLHIVSIIGGPREKKRANALFYDFKGVPDSLTIEPLNSLCGATKAFWQDSRHEALIDAVHVHVFENSVRLPPPDSRPNATEQHSSTDDFWSAMYQTCIRLLADDPIPHPRSLFEESPSEKEGIVSQVYMERASVTKTNPRLTAHTVTSFLRGAAQRCTTLTANRASVKELVKEMAADGWAPEATGLHIGNFFRLDAKDSAYSEITDMSTSELRSAIWVVEPRSLAEVMRSDFEG